MRRTELEQFLERKGFIRDKYGHYQKSLSDGSIYRYKLQATSVRREVKANIGGRNEWLRLGGDYYKYLYVDTEDKLAPRYKLALKGG